jgi:hypothetical protein
MKSVRVQPSSLVVSLVGTYLCVIILLAPSSAYAQQDDESQDASRTGQFPTNPDSPADLPSTPPASPSQADEGIDHTNGPLPAGRLSSVFTRGHLSLLSASTFYEYDSNEAFTPQPQSVNAFGLQALVAYSFGTERTALDLRYRPSLLVSGAATRFDWAANSFDLRLSHYLTPRWRLNLDDAFQYVPAQGRLLDPTIRPDLSIGTVSRDPFLTNGEAALSDAASVRLSYATEHDTFTFRGQYQYADQWTPSNLTKSAKPTTQTQTLFQQENVIGGGMSWFHEIREGQQFGVSYGYDRQILKGNLNRTQYHSVMINYSQSFGSSLSLLAAFGPSWQLSGNKTPTSKTYVGDVTLLKKFQTSTLALSYLRNYEYVGVISNGYNTRYDGYYAHTLANRWEVSAGAGYAQQAFRKLSNFDGREEWARLSYSLREKVGAFVSITNSGAQGAGLPYAGRNLIVAGFHWGYQGESGMQP